ncbi:hypothetical protein SDC9_119462 [bioreactor metagenome]|uniref:Uncharacterized protein n=1 Tax=bioreactor metagenome TaxID=1076179 RepID=A0A645C3V4_9ZZZZ
MPVVNMGVGNDVNQLPRRKPADLRQQVHQHGVLHHVPAVGREHVLRALVEHGVENSSADIEGHGPGAGVQRHL